MGSQRLPAEARGLEQNFSVWRAAACLGAGLTLLPASCRVTGARLRQLLAFFLTSAVHRRADMPTHFALCHVVYNCRLRPRGYAHSWLPVSPVSESAVSAHGYAHELIPRTS